MLPRQSQMAGGHGMITSLIFDTRRLVVHTMMQHSARSANTNNAKIVDLHVCHYVSSDHEVRRRSFFRVGCVLADSHYTYSLSKQVAEMSAIVGVISQNYQGMSGASAAPKAVLSSMTQTVVEGMGIGDILVNLSGLWLRLISNFTRLVLIEKTHGSWLSAPPSVGSVHGNLGALNSFCEHMSSVFNNEAVILELTRAEWNTHGGYIQNLFGATPAILVSQADLNNVRQRTHMILDGITFTEGFAFHVILRDESSLAPILAGIIATPDGVVNPANEHVHVKGHMHRYASALMLLATKLPDAQGILYAYAEVCANLFHPTLAGADVKPGSILTPHFALDGLYRTGSVPVIIAGCCVSMMQRFTGPQLPVGPSISAMAAVLKALQCTKLEVPLMMNLQMTFALEAVLQEHSVPFACLYSDMHGFMYNNILLPHYSYSTVQDVHRSFFSSEGEGTAAGIRFYQKFGELFGYNLPHDFVHSIVGFRDEKTPCFFPEGHPLEMARAVHPLHIRGFVVPEGYKQQVVFGASVSELTSLFSMTHNGSECLLTPTTIPQQEDGFFNPAMDLAGFNAFSTLAIFSENMDLSQASNDMVFTCVPVLGNKGSASSHGSHSTHQSFTVRIRAKYDFVSRQNFVTPAVGDRSLFVKRGMLPNADIFRRTWLGLSITPGSFSRLLFAGGEVADMLISFMSWDMTKTMLLSENFVQARKRLVFGDPARTTPMMQKAGIDATDADDEQKGGKKARKETEAGQGEAPT